MTLGQAAFLQGFLLPQLKSEQIITKRIVSAVPPDKGDYKPDAKSKSAIELAWHIALVEIWFLDAVIHRCFGETAAKPVTMKTCGEVAGWYQKSFAERLTELEAQRAQSRAATRMRNPAIQAASA